MKVVFLGPSLPLEVAQEILPDAIFLPPVGQGDIVSLCRKFTPESIGIVDGVFRKTVAVWHKEILFALKQGIPVYGSSSMGALRAVECKPWGATPIGTVSRWVEEGTVSDADVAISHADAEFDYRPLSIPVVTVLATAQSAGLSGDRIDALVKAARSIFYPDRTWNSVFAAAECSPEETAALKAFKTDIKAEDAKLLLTRMASAPDPVQGKVPENERVAFGKLLHYSDTKIALHSGGNLRMYELSQRASAMTASALNRELALEFCRLAGITPDENIEAPAEGEMDLTPAEVLLYLQEENMLTKAQNWLNTARPGYGSPKAILNFLRSVGLYESTKA